MRCAEMSSTKGRDDEQVRWEKEVRWEREVRRAQDTFTLLLHSIPRRCLLDTDDETKVSSVERLRLILLKPARQMRVQAVCARQFSRCVSVWAFAGGDADAAAGEQMGADRGGGGGGGKERQRQMQMQMQTQSPPPPPPRRTESQRVGKAAEREGEEKRVKKFIERDQWSRQQHPWPPPPSKPP